MDSPKVDVAAAASPTPPGAGPIGRMRRWLAWSLGLVGGAGLVAGLAIGLSRVRWEAPSPAKAEGLLDSRRYREAAREAEACLAIKPDDARTLFLLARARAGMEDWAGCISALERVPEWSRKRAEADLVVAQSYRQLHRSRDAEAALRRGIARDPDGPVGMKARLDLLAILAMEERREAFRSLAWDIYARLAEPERLSVLAMRMKIEFEQTKPELSIKSLRTLLEADPGDAHARAGLAIALDHAGRPDAASREFRRALDELPGDPEVRERYLDLLRRSGDRETFRAVLAARPEGADARPETRKFLGMEAESGDLEAAERHYSAAVAADPSVPEYHHRLAGVLSRLGKRDQAAKQAAERDQLNEAREALHGAWNDFADAFESDPGRVNGSLLLGMARACEACGWDREAAAWFREALRLSPDDSAARAGLERVESIPQG